MTDEQFPLSAKKSKWAKNRKVHLQGKRLNHNVGIQQKYHSQLYQLVLLMTQETQKEIKKLFKKTAQDKMTFDESRGSQARILLNKLSAKFIRLFKKKAKDVSKQMFGSISKVSKTNLHSSLKQLSGGLSLKTGIVPEGFQDIASATIAENVSLIKSLPEEYYKQITGAVMRSITEEKGLAFLVPELQKYDGMTARRAKNIALDQTRKAYNTINAKRLQALNVTHFEWLHSGGGASPRESHMRMDGHIFSFEHLEKEQEAMGIPKQDRGLPSIPPNCGCTILPIIDLSGD